MTANLTIVAALTGAEIFRAFCNLERIELDECNQDYLFVAPRVPVEHYSIHGLMEKLGNDALESDKPIELLQRYKSYLENCAEQIEDITEQVSRHRAMARETVRQINLRHRIRVPAVSISDAN